MVMKIESKVEKIALNEMDIVYICNECDLGDCIIIGNMEWEPNSCLKGEKSKGEPIAKWVPVKRDQTDVIELSVDQYLYICNKCYNYTDCVSIGAKSENELCCVYNSGGKYPFRSLFHGWRKYPQDLVIYDDHINNRISLDDAISQSEVKSRGLIISKEI
jgi:hypothetical protein